MISENDAINIAKQLAADNSWGWCEPAEVIFRRSWFGKPLRYEVFSNALGFGPKVRVFIDANTGEIIEKGYIKR
jgi:hypothetical protein